MKRSDMADKIFKADFSVTDVNDELGLVFGWGMITGLNGEDYYDTDNQHISSDMMLKSTTGFMQSLRISNDSHTESDIGQVIHSFPLSKEIADSMGITSNINGWMVAVNPTPEIIGKFKSGEYKGFSIEGKCEWEDIGE